MAEKSIQLGQIRPNGLTAVSIFTPRDPRTSIFIETIVVCNTDVAGAKFSIYHDDDGEIYDETTALFFEEQSAGKETKIIAFSGGLAMQGKTFNKQAGNLAVQTNKANAFTFTIYGKKVR